MKASLVLFAFAGTLALTSTVRASITEGFDTFPPAGWTFFNQSSAPLGINWSPGNTAVFTAQAGADGSYAAVTWQSTAGGVGNETLDNWLITPTLTGIQNGDTVSFFTRTATDNTYPDRLELRMSTNGGTNAGGTTGSTGDFATLLASVNPDLTVGGYPENWTQISVTIAGLSGPVNGALRASLLCHRRRSERRQ